MADEVSVSALGEAHPVPPQRLGKSQRPDAPAGERGERSPGPQAGELAREQGNARRGNKEPGAFAAAAAPVAVSEAQARATDCEILSGDGAGRRSPRRPSPAGRSLAG